MKITQRWLAEFTSVDESPAALAAQLTLSGLEVEGYAAAAPAFSEVVVGEVLECARHPDADRLSVCVVTTDGQDRLQIVCGAPNVRAGLRVAVARVGARLPGGVAIRRSKLRGVESQGMLCSARELGLGTEHDGILELPAEFATGADLRTALDLDDVVFEVNATPNRGDCMSVLGIARDHAAARERRRLMHPVAAVTARHEEIREVRLEAGAACPVFANRLIRGVRAGGQSPLWLRERLRRVGVNSISPIVDVTNYVMLELGQPMHAYDAGLLQGAVSVRWARGGERLTLLDDREYALAEDHLVIADVAGAISLAGIMGGRRTAICERTTDVFLEVAHFDPAAVAGRARRLGLFTDSAQRFERGVDPTLPVRAIERATALLLEIAGGEPGPVDVRRVGGEFVPRPLELRRERLERMLGTSVPESEVGEILAAICEQVSPTAAGWRASAPPHRFDLAIEVDLIEEVARLRGFDRIPERHAVAPQIAGVSSETRLAPERILEAMIDRGYREVITYSFVDPVLQRTLFPEAKALELANPISNDLAQMRVSLWPGLVHAARENLRRQQSRLRLIEAGRRFVLEDATLREIETLSGLVTGPKWPEQWGSARESADFYDVKADLEGLFALTGDHGDWRFQADAHPTLRPGRTARIERAGLCVGWLGELHPGIAKALDLPSGIWLFELDSESAFACNKLYFKKISKFPSVRRDLAVVVEERVTFAELLENVTLASAGLLTDLFAFDVYRGPGIEAGRKSVALGLILQDSSRTLTDVDADTVVASVAQRLRDVFSATIRDQ
ncbi:MAG: phenylalanine--tRNA ligase subunit beta [Gammaproteobacteria bacterium]|nr:phenylalanine--tRNA ligase subunit beta [Gammaproteobacteria bacterium]